MPEIAVTVALPPKVEALLGTHFRVRKAALRSIGRSAFLEAIAGVKGLVVAPGVPLSWFVFCQASQPKAAHALALAYARHGDTLAVVRLDRLGRSLGELLTTVTMLKERGIALLSLEEKIDTSSAAGELIFHVFGAIAHFERRLIAERTKDGIAAARAKGKRPGRQPLDADRVEAALKLVAAGLSPTVDGRQLGLGRSTVYREVSRAGTQRGG